MSKPIKVALLGNPNTGKTSLFNQLTGLHQKVGNYPGVTVEKKMGLAKLDATHVAEILDLPGTYSINPTSEDESIVFKTLFDKTVVEYPDVLVVVADVENLKRNLLLFSQIKDLEIPTILVINMVDQMQKKGIYIDVVKLQAKLNSTVVTISARTNEGIENVKTAIIDNFITKKAAPLCAINHKIDATFFDKLQSISPNYSLYQLWLMVTQNNYPDTIDPQEKEKLIEFRTDVSKIRKYQHKETIYRYQEINAILKEAYQIDTQKATALRYKLDRIFTHKIFGYIIFVGILLVIFQSIFSWATIPMDFIDGVFASLSAIIQQNLPAGILTELLAEGIVPGIGGVVIFIPQIAFLFLFIAILEETGYMSRVVFLMDKIMSRFGLSGKSIISLISGTACAIPAIMATRNIDSWKERLITILVTPFTTCSARLPVYAILIALIIPNQYILGIFNLQGLTLLFLYLLGFSTAVIAGFILNKLIKINSKSYFVIELPDYKVPSLKNVTINVFEKTKAFVFGAGKIILALSVVLWFLASHGPNQSLVKTTQTIENQNIGIQKDTQKLENSYIGIIGKKIEPVLQPLGYDWKIGIALLTSFAAREVFVATLATIYSVDSEDESTIKNRMANEVNALTGKKQFTFPVGMSLLIFYAFAMQCMATFAIVKKETNSWRWPIVQLVFMGLFAYFMAFATYQILS